ncbi:hypothetical protein CO174_05190 [Candidatus Uhrbacteria bacterium CG_4_9_14_3_um_filter_50_9]|uniref:DUF3307 domain-containing protein n=1 Tax=Candidatus Uhrbacteria bacterium CG_4_9_14_3_um_filter_50_9 TaxID=1975035 RepID=A0A2M7XB01_9BACT|nr:MAG: hypothetical protein CO174_05190 [Candidatus Uhrbacteria bacterium CG_4_9_14_3_um_filter_50_9]
MSLSDPIMRLLVYFATHFIGDFAFQSTWMVSEKGKSWEVLIYHVLVWSAPFVLLLLIPELQPYITPEGLLVNSLSHIVIDALKARYNVIKTIWQDQLCHLGVITILWAINWL